MLHKKIEREYPSSSWKERKKILDTHWKKICLNVNANKKRLINMDEYKKVMVCLQNKINKTQSSLLNFWSKTETTTSNRTIKENRKRSQPPQTAAAPPPKRPQTEPPATPAPAPTPRAYKQQQQVDIINDINSKIAGLIEEKSKPYRDIKRIDADIKQLQKTKKTVKNKLNRLVSNAKASKKRRKKERAALIKCKQKYPNDQSIIMREKRGRPPVEVWCPGLGAIIQNIVNGQCAADGRRRTEAVTYASSLDQLTEELNKRGFELSRQTSYLRLMPRRPNSCLAEDRMMKQIASYLGIM